MSDPAIIAARELTVTIAGISVCEKLNFSVAPGQCWAILGRNGAGKTTLLHTLAGLRTPAAGAIALDGRPLAALSTREVARIRGLLTQDDSDAFGATVLETAMIGRHPYLSRWQWESAEDLRIAREALTSMDIADAERRDVRTLSGGERRRAALAALLTQQPRLLLLDEPSSHLDLAHQLAVLRRLTGLARDRGAALIMVLHDINLARRFCDHALTLDHGIAVAGSAEELLTAVHLSKIYGVTLNTIGQGEGTFFVPS
jgi:iron complex transport system ATP-binding protein